MRPFAKEVWSWVESVGYESIAALAYLGFVCSYPCSTDETKVITLDQKIFESDKKIRLDQLPESFAFT